MSIRRLGVVGAGTMGGGIAEVAAAAKRSALRRSEVAPDGVYLSLAVTASTEETAVARTGAGGVFPRVFSMIVNEAAFAVGDGVATPGDVDTALRLGAAYPAGVFAQADRIGLDVILAVLDAVHREQGEDRYRAASLLRKMVAAGWTGVSAGRGFVTGA